MILLLNLCCWFFCFVLLFRCCLVCLCLLDELCRAVCRTFAKGGSMGDGVFKGGSCKQCQGENWKTMFKKIANAPP